MNLCARWSPEEYLGIGFSKWLLSQPWRLLSEEERKQGLESAESMALAEPMHALPESLSLPSPLFATVGAPLPSSVDVVVAGICQGKTVLEKENWLQYGPTLEAVIGLDLAADLACRLGAALHIWVVDQEYANVAAQKGNPGLELALGKRCRDFVRTRYPQASHFETSDDAVRGCLYAAASDLRVATLYPDKVRHPYNIPRPTLWDQFDYLSCVASMLLPAFEGRTVCAVVDHDQLRPASAARLIAGEAITPLLFWPVPQLSWCRSGHRGDHERLLHEIKKFPRRMHRAKDHWLKLHIEDSAESLKDRFSTVERELSKEAIDEVCAYLDVVPPSPSKGGFVEDCSAVLGAAITQLRHRRQAGH